VPLNMHILLQSPITLLVHEAPYFASIHTGSIQPRLCQIVMKKLRVVFALCRAAAVPADCLARWLCLALVTLRSRRRMSASTIGTASVFSSVGALIHFDEAKRHESSWVVAADEVRQVWAGINDSLDFEGIIGCLFIHLH